ncbi:Crp/Fnr family transcriptional regulator [Qipengyuania sp. 6B39]|uniref:Crp/Fnr family transcriptional regulator n=1 Tax=Qipengyuania proteolytica TaxID=2867239 RepID=UPI001C89BEAE|nr:Crp/Fnr family transcriptional regulator [Qipengyuania proteolytica]MBX7494435.1 Crp/Fnr family transcriptional regulator [Qipengyuania proteolytica]
MSNSIHSLPTRRSLGTPMLFEALDPALRVHLLRGARLREFGDGQIIQQRGTAADGFWLIEEGAVMVGQFLPEGEFRAVALLGPGDSYGELAVFSGRPRIVDAVSRGPSRVRFIAARPFLDALGNYPASTRALLGALSEQLQDTLGQLAGLRRGTSAARLAGILANMADTAPGMAEVRITQQELAELLGVTRATANAALRDLEKRRLVKRGYGSIAIPDVPRLTLFALE